MTTRTPPPFSSLLPALAGAALLFAAACGGGGGGGASRPASPELYGTSSGQVHPGEAVALTGEDLVKPVGVYFGETLAPWWESYGPTGLVAVVPDLGPKATGEPVTVSVQTADGPTPAGAVTVAYSPRAAATPSFQPTSGAPGTMVVLQGDFSSQAAPELTFAGPTILGVPSRVPPAAVQVDGAGQLHFWVPDLAESGPVQMKVSGGTFDLDYFVVLPPRMEALLGTFQVTRQGVTGQPLYDYPQVARANQYPDLSLPMAPVLHPFDPMAGWRTGIVPTYTVNLQLPSSFRDALPAEVLARIQDEDISLDDVDIFCNTQNQGWKVTKDAGSLTMEVRPQTWLFQGAPGAVSDGEEYLAGAWVDISLFDPHHYGVGWLNGSGNRSGLVSVFASNMFNPDDRLSVLSWPDNLKLTGLDYQGDSAAFWTLTVNGKRAEATLHVVNNDQDQDTLATVMAAAEQAPQVGQLLAAYALFPTSSQDPNKELRRLFRPIVTRAFLDGTTLTILGSGFKGNSGPLGGLLQVGTVHVADKAVDPTITDFTLLGSVQVLSDSEITVSLPAGQEANSVTVSDLLGDSDPVLVQ